MLTIFEAANALEAHMVKNLLATAGISAQVQGEHLQSGVGELPAIGLVKVVVAPEDETVARSVIDDWEAQQAADPRQPSQTGHGHHTPPATPHTAPPTTARERRIARLSLLLIGAIAGSTTTFMLLRAPTTTHGSDFDGDGRVDQRCTYNGDVLTTCREDRNGDGDFDVTYEYADDGRVVSASADNDFDGSVDTRTFFEHNLPVRTTVDTDGDGRPDLERRFQDGLLSEQRFIDDTNGCVRKVQHFVMERLVRAEHDVDCDGTMDRIKRYDAYENVIQRSSRAPAPPG